MRPSPDFEAQTDPRPPAVALTIAGFDPSSGAGISADLSVFAAHGIFGTSAITATTVQSTMGVAGVRAADPAWLLRTLEFVSTDLPAAGVKVGMLATDPVVRAVAGFLLTAQGRIPVVFDPVIRSSSGFELLDPAALRRIDAEFLPLVGWITPNWAELSVLSGVKVRTIEDVNRAADALGKKHPGLYIVATGGDQEEPVDFLRAPGGAVQTFRGERVETTSTHGTGCAFSAALLSRLILGDAPAKAVGNAKAYVTEALRSAPAGLGNGRGPLNLLWPLRTRRRVNC
ncbi:MAG TPA: bifunctional hydroxymethylpyrimidine kinase/phosphomethylpyrimidine kinase [Acidobacteriaceae bacterium]|nr:bifunctional hydroxymethylpyrimidine kinase/phosphomethylpyrimidine kinase [Acidobacteriaceae bacterium]